MKTKTFISIFLSILILVIIWQIFSILKGQEQKTMFMSKEKIIREPAVIGQFYPTEKKELENQLAQFFKQTKPPSFSSSKRISALIVPHAGYPFSGPVAAFAYQALAENFKDSLNEEKTIILIGPSHHYPINGIIIDNSDLWKTPLGLVEVDKNLRELLKKQASIFQVDSLPHQFEHSLEVQIPFLQKIFPKFKILPLLVNQLNEEELIKASQILAGLANEQTIFIASSDLSHYPSYVKANYADKKVIEAILSGKTENLEKTIQALEKENIPNAFTFLCGQEAVELVMKIAEQVGASEIKLLNYANSGDSVFGDKNQVVGYAAIAFLNEEQLLSRQDKETLLKIARETVETYIRTGKIPKFSFDTPSLNQKLGAFVTIKKNGNLRGCIGRFSPTDLPLFQVVAQMALAAATQDLRFAPIKIDELKDLSYEISVLSPLKQIDDWRKIEIGKHGVEIRLGFRSGVFLPQVATENNWDLETFLSMLCLEKMGLAATCYQEKNAQIYIFTAQVFGEE